MEVDNYSVSELAGVAAEDVKVLTSNLVELEVAGHMVDIADMAEAAGKNSSHSHIADSHIVEDHNKDHLSSAAAPVSSSTCQTIPSWL